MPSGTKINDAQRRIVIDMHLVHKVPVPALAERYGIHRKSIYRWLDAYKKSNKENDMAEAKSTDNQPKEDALAAPEGEHLQPDTNQVVVQAPKPEHDVPPADTPLTPEEVAKSNKPYDPTQPAKSVEDEVVEPAQAEDQAANAKENDCPNPSCKGGKLKDGDCSKCGYSESVSVR